VELINPDLLVKGGDYAADEIAGAAHMKKQGGEVRILPLSEGCSTSRIVDKIRTAGRGPA
jgi:D-beta-D-heptose 7-phosphate kinase/D-beta-D-heptose 1-phosphate adenosyltransferase